MTVNRMAGCALVLLGIINVLHEIVVRNSGRGRPGSPYAIVTALLFSVGTALLLWPRHSQRRVRASRLSKD